MILSGLKLESARADLHTCTHALAEANLNFKLDFSELKLESARAHLHTCTPACAEANLNFLRPAPSPHPTLTPPGTCATGAS